MDPLEMLRARTLVVDDDPEFIDLLAIQLGQDDAVEHEIERRHSLAAGVEALAQREFDVILLDLGLPDSTGSGTLRSVLDVAGETPVIVLTSTADWGFRNPAIRLGAEDYVVKDGLEASVLNRSVRHALERRTLRVELENAREQARRERELREMVRMSEPRPSALPADPLREADPESFERLRVLYMDSVALLVASRTHAISSNASSQLRTLAELLGQRGGGPRDVMHMHTETMNRIVGRFSHAEIQAWTEEGRLAVLEVMGHLASYYRDVPPGRADG